MDINKYYKSLYGPARVSPCPFTDKEISELENTSELLIYLPSGFLPEELCNLFKIKTNVDFENEKLIHNVMTKENQWFIASASKTPEMLYKTAHEASRVYEDEGLHGMDLRRYLAFTGIFKNIFGEFPDHTYWIFLLSGNYDRSGVSIVGFDRNGVLSHHGWMKNFKAKFVGSRYIILPPRIEINTETQRLKRTYRGVKVIE